MNGITEDRIVELIIQGLTGDLDPVQVEQLHQWAKEDKANLLLLQRLATEEILRQELGQWKKIDPVQGYLRWRKQVRWQRTIRYFAVAAGLIAVMAMLTVIVNNSSRKVQSVPVPVVKVEMPAPVLPGKNTAMLTLSNGRQIRLDDSGKGEIAADGGARLVKSGSGTIVYLDSGRSLPSSVVYNTLITPRAGHYELTLPDGSRVWLNNASSLHYPTSFREVKRKVTLTGEAYFEIAKDAMHPFAVTVGGQEVEVLGTSFNIMAYSDEPRMETTLVDGSIRVTAQGKAIVLKPDEQVHVDAATGKVTNIISVSSEDILSWKNGFFYFDKTPFATVLRQFARWYDIEVVYKGEIPQVEYTGKFDRNLTLDDLLKFLYKEKIQFRLESRKLIVLPS